MNDPSYMMNRGFGIWPAPPPLAEDPMGFPNPARPPPRFAVGGAPKSGRMNWKAQKGTGMRKNAAPGGGPVGGVSAYKPPTLHELQYQNRVKARRFYPKKKFARFAPFAPRNTTSFIIRAKKSGGIAPLVSPYAVTPAVLPTPKLSPTREDLADMVKEEWGVDGYGSMKGLIRLRSPSCHDTRPSAAAGGEEDDEDEEGSGESDVEEHLEVERRLDHDVSRFEMVYPGEEDHDLETDSGSDLLVSRVDDQDAHIAQLEEENLTLKERLFLMETEMAELRRRLHLLEARIIEREDSKDDDNNNKKDAINSGKPVGVVEPENEEDGEELSDDSSGAPMLEFRCPRFASAIPVEIQRSKLYRMEKRR
ncbi:nudix hydrolase 23 [Musa troglodytarum]|uniref:Nudix hydrolase 23 n=1 Tax=Musa troglodytarum TaxID=320322 RepID=A0A9E7ICY6_9LILI|nr:nudix hydrolase 23 [Musa troglodytarum]